jgi:competence CoiA-like predicted nuclease
VARRCNKSFEIILEVRCHSAAVKDVLERSKKLKNSCIKKCWLLGTQLLEKSCQNSVNVGTVILPISLLSCSEETA